LQCNYDKKNRLQQPAIAPMYPSNPAPKQKRSAGLRHRLFSRGFTLVEVMVATVLLSMVILGILAVLIGSYRVAAKARYNDHARYIVKSLADQFLTQDSIDPQTGETITMFVPTSGTGLGLSWTTTAADGTQTVATGTAAGLQVALSDTATTGDAPVIAKVMRSVWYVDPASGNVSLNPIPNSAGAMLRGDFTVSYQFMGATLPPQTVSAIRATP
jgi:prepilin-type N-terminal cleavage/methylation domain-containing protein